MKIRTGFVANSSSSSFIIAFNNQIDYIEFKNMIDKEKLNFYIKDYQLIESVDEIIQDAYDDYVSTYNTRACNGLQLNEWVITNKLSYSDDLYDTPFLALLTYNAINRDTLNLKIKEFYN